MESFLADRMYLIILYDDVIGIIYEESLVEISNNEPVKGNKAGVGNFDSSAINSIAEDGYGMPRKRLYGGGVARRSRRTIHQDEFIIRTGFDVQGIATADLAYAIINPAPRV